MKSTRMRRFDQSAKRKDMSNDFLVGSGFNDPFRRLTIQQLDDFFGRIIRILQAKFTADTNSWTRYRRVGKNDSVAEKIIDPGVCFLHISRIVSTKDKIARTPVHPANSTSTKQPAIASPQSILCAETAFCVYFT